MREAECFSVVLKSIWVGEYDTINQHNCKKIAQLRNKMYNCKKNGTTAKLYVGIIQEISTTAKKMAFPVGGKTHCALIAAHASDVQNKKRDTKGRR